jgi:hypothetical protein
MSRLSALRPASHPNWLEWWAFCTALAVLILTVVGLLAAAALLGEYLGTLTDHVSPETGRVAAPIVVGTLYLHAAWWRYRR